MLFLQTETQYICLLFNHTFICHFSNKLVNLIITNKMFLGVPSQHRSLNHALTPAGVLHVPLHYLLLQGLVTSDSGSPLFLQFNKMMLSISSSQIKNGWGFL